WHPLQFRPEEIDKLDSEPESGYRQPEEGKGRAKEIGWAISFHRGNRARGNGDNNCNHKRKNGEVERDREGAPNKCPHGLTADRRTSEITLKYIPEPDPISGGQRLVESKLFAQDRDVFRSCALPQHHGRGTARDEINDKKDDPGNKKE